MARLHDYAELQALARDRRPRVALVLGSGLSDLADRLADAVELPFSLAPGLDAASVPGHRGVLSLGAWAGTCVLVFAGRLHYYEGHSWPRAVQLIHIAHELGASVLLATNAAGGINMAPGDLMALSAHLDWTRSDGDLLEARRTRAASPYSPRLLGLLRQVDPAMKTGVYAQLTGPCYETPAEIRALSVCGADAVGMSTAREMQTAFELGLECAAISCITNLAAGLSAAPIHHQEVLEMGQRVKVRLIRAIEGFLAAV